MTMRSSGSGVMNNSTSSTHVTIRPVTQKCPSSAELVDDSGLPTSLVITPAASVAAATSSSSSLRPLSSVPKCLACGAPQFSKLSMYTMGYDVFCKVCFKQSSIRFQDQAHHRISEDMQPSLYPTSMGWNNFTNKASGEFALPVFKSMERVPAMTCPPVWWLVMDGTATCSSSSSNYWKAVQQAVSSALKGVPEYVHVGLLVLQNNGGLSVWDLTSPVPHVKNYNNTTMEGLDLDVLVPSTPNHLSNLQAALRALGDTSASSNRSRSGSHNVAKNNTKQEQLGLAIQAKLDYMMETCTHPGGGVDNHVDADSSLKYAGGKVTCFLSSVHDATAGGTTPSTTSIGTGGFGGSCAEQGKRFSTKDDEAPPPTDNKNDDYNEKTNFKMASYFQDLGQACAEAALGVDVLVLHSGDSADRVGLPYLRVLSDRSGAPGPLIFSLSSNNNNSSNNNVDLLCREVQSRVPWNPSVVFGALLRVRMSPGLDVIDSTSEDDSGNAKKKHYSMARFHGSGGLLGPATAANSNSSSNLLWRMGSCNKDTNVTLDFDISAKQLKDSVHLEGYGYVAMQPTVQMCFAYTQIVSLKDEYFTVRRLYVENCQMPLAGDCESLYNSLDPEALAVSLFHKLTITSIQRNLLETQVAGQYWLVTLLVNVYRSARKHNDALLKSGGGGTGIATNNDDNMFYVQERLLNQEGGMLDTTGVLLAQGHDRLCTCALLVFCLLQCDALRPSTSINVDARCAASGQMFSMTPSALSRCIAPRLELWQANGREPIMEHVDLSMERVREAVVEHEKDGSSTSDNDLILLLDSPRLILVLNCRQLFGEERSNNIPELSNELQSSIDVACHSYRVPPPVVYALEDSPSAEMALLRDFLVEDSATVDGLDNFGDWKTEIAGIVLEEISK